MTQQPFSLDLQPALNAYVATLANARQQNLTLQEMQGSQQTYQQSLGRKWNVLNDVVKRGGTPQEVAYHLGHFLQDWAIMEALSLIVSKQVWIDPQDQDVQYAFWNKLELQCNWLQSQLWPSSSSQVEEAFDDLEEEAFDDLFDDLEEEDRPAADHPTQELEIARVLPQPSTTHPISSRQQVQPSPDLELLEELRRANQDARDSLRLAMEANRVTGKALADLVGPATDLIKSANSKPKEYDDRYDSLPSYEVQTTNQPVRRVMRRIWFVLLLGLIVLALFAFVFVGLHFLY